MYSWGRGEYGRLGLNDPTGSSRLKPNLITGLHGHRVVQVCTGKFELIKYLILIWKQVDLIPCA